MKKKILSKQKSLSFKNKDSFGIGLKTLTNIRKQFGINLRKVPNKLKSKHKNQIRRKLLFLESGKLLKENIKSFITFYEDLKTYAGIRHKFNYPTRGQRTRTNAKTRRKISKKKK